MITVYGEALVDLVPTSADPLAPLQPALGGGPFNVARALGRLGADVKFQSRLSRDAFGTALQSSLIDAGGAHGLADRSRNAPLGGGVCLPAGRVEPAASYSTVTDFARLRGWSTFRPRASATAQAKICSGTVDRIGCNRPADSGTRMTSLA